MKYQFTSNSAAIIKKTIRSFGTDVGKLEPCTLLLEMLNDVATLKNSLCVCVCVCVSCLVVWLFETPWTVACQASLSRGFSRQEFWSVLPFPPPGDLPNPGIEPKSLMSPALAGRFFMSSGTWEALRNSLAILKNVTPTMTIWPFNSMNTRYIVLFTIGEKWKQRKCLPMDEWLN